MAQQKYTQAEWRKDKLLVAKLGHAQRFDHLREFLENVFLVSEGSVSDEVRGMLFMLDICHPKKR